MQDSSVKSSLSRQKAINMGIAAAIGITLGVALDSLAIGFGAGIVIAYSMRSSANTNMDDQKRDKIK